MKITKRIGAYKKLSNESKLTQNLLWSFAGNRLGMRSSINEEKTLHLLSSQEFKNRITQIRKDLDIPRLKTEDDVLEVEIDNAIEAESKWLNSEPKEVYSQLKHEVITLLAEFNLSPNFGDWIFGYILYRTRGNKPSFDWSLVDYVIDNLHRIEEITLTTGEKQYILDLFRLKASSNSKLTKSQVNAKCLELKKILARSKRNTARRSRSINTAHKTLKIGKKTTYYEPDVNKNIERKITSLSLASELFETDEVKKSHTLRKQKQRFKERGSRLLKQKVKR